MLTDLLSPGGFSVVRIRPQYLELLGNRDNITIGFSNKCHIQEHSCVHISLHKNAFTYTLKIKIFEL